jgi:hypothetical protein
MIVLVIIKGQYFEQVALLNLLVDYWIDWGMVHFLRLIFLAKVWLSSNDSKGFSDSDDLKFTYIDLSIYLATWVHPRHQHCYPIVFSYPKSRQSSCNHSIYNSHCRIFQPRNIHNTSSSILTSYMHIPLHVFQLQYHLEYWGRCFLESAMNGVK